MVQVVGFDSQAKEDFWQIKLNSLGRKNTNICLVVDLKWK